MTFTPGGPLRLEDVPTVMMERVGPNQCPGRNPILVTGGGGVRGAYQAGAAWYLIHVRNCVFEHYIGTSTGAITAAILAQSTNQEELKRNVSILVKNYLDVKTQDDLITPRTFGSIRLFLPRWLGGTTGLYTMEPTIKLLKGQVDVSKLTPERISLTAVSLQSGPLVDQKPVDILDHVIGSASIPIAFAPRVARLWTRGKLIGIGQENISIETKGVPGLSDEKCLFKWKGMPPMQCVFVENEPLAFRLFEGSLEEPTETEFRWKITLSVKNLSKDLRDSLHTLLSSTGGDREKEVQFTTVHQLVDGGVANQLPIDKAWGIWWERRTGKQNVPSVIIALSTGSSAISKSPNEKVEDTLGIASTSFEFLWSKYQSESHERARLWAEYQDSTANGQAWIARAYTWWRELNSKASADERTKLQSRLTNTFPAGRDVPISMIPALSTTPDSDFFPQYLRDMPKVLVVTPTRRFFSDTLEADPIKIRKAIHDGCKAAFTSLVEPLSDPFTSRSFDISNLTTTPCDALAPNNVEGTITAALHQWHANQ